MALVTTKIKCPKYLSAFQINVMFVEHKVNHWAPNVLTKISNIKREKDLETQHQV